MLVEDENGSKPVVERIVISEVLAKLFALRLALNGSLLRRYSLLGPKEYVVWS